MINYQLMAAGVTEEAAAEWWLKTFAGVDGPIYCGRWINKRGTPIFDTNWSPAQALIALKYRESGLALNTVARIIGKSWHAVRDLFARVDAAQGIA